MRSKCFLGSSLSLFWFVLFYFFSLLPPLSRKPLLPHLQGICFTQRAPGEWKTNAAPALGPVPGHSPGVLPARLRQGCAPGWSRVPGGPSSAGRGAGDEEPSSLLLQQGSGMGVLPSRGRVSYLRVLSLLPSTSV